MVYIVDPYHIFHETRWNKNLWFGSQTLINLGQIETYLKRSNDYDGILVGSSHSMNFKGSDLAKAVGAKGVLKLCGGNQHVESSCNWVKYAMTTGKVKYVIIGFNFLMPPATEAFGGKKVSFFNQVIFSVAALKDQVKLNLHRSNINNTYQNWSDPDSIYNWFLRKKRDFDCWSSNRRALMPYIANTAEFGAYQIKDPISAVLSTPIIKDINRLLILIRDNAAVKFYLMIPPNSWLQYDYVQWAFRKVAPSRRYDAFFFGWRHLITACADLPNVKIYGWHDCAFVSNLANYRDPGHYHPDINRYMAWCIEHDKHRLTKENYDAYEARCVENLRAFKILDSYPHRDTFDELVAAEMQDGN